MKQTESRSKVVQPGGVVKGGGKGRNMAEHSMSIHCTLKTWMSPYSGLAAVVYMLSTVKELPCMCNHYNMYIVRYLGATLSTLPTWTACANFHQWCVKSVYLAKQVVEWFVSTCCTTRELIVHCMQVNSSLHAQIYYLTCDLYCILLPTTHLIVIFCRFNCFNNFLGSRIFILRRNKVTKVSEHCLGIRLTWGCTCSVQSQYYVAHPQNPKIAHYSCMISWLCNYSA